MIHLDKISKIFDQRGIAGIHSVSWEISAGEIVALLGPNGCGKTTLLKLISGELQPSSGSIKRSGKIHFLRHPQFDPAMKVQNFLIHQAPLDIEDEEKKIQMARDFADIFEFTFQLKQKMGELSQGQLQKVLLASELQSLPEILFMDEPFVHLDPLTRKEILGALFRFIKLKEMTVLWVTHETQEALRFADTMALMQHGKLEQIGNPQQLLFQPHNLFVAQFMGYQNFLPVDCQDNQTCITPWGKLSFEGFTSPQALLVIPPTAIKLVSDSPLSGTITALYPQGHKMELEIDCEGKRYYAQMQPLELKAITLNSRVYLAPDLTQCFLMKL